MKSYWKTTPYPTLEITTSIPPKGCVVDCVFCPQRLLVKSYKGNKTLSFEDFKKVVDRLPIEVRIAFSGFTEPWLNQSCTDMVLYAYERGHRVSAFTTGIGMKVEDLERIRHINWDNGPNGGFVFHLPDDEHYAKHPITPRYIQVVEYFHNIYRTMKNTYVMAMGTVHKSVAHVFPTAHTGQMYSRAGNLMHESILKPELLNLKDHYKTVYNGEGNFTCGCDERLYHNVMIPNGDVSLCCMDYGLEYILGNLFEQEYDEIMPKPLACFDLCKFCENGIKPSKLGGVDS